MCYTGDPDVIADLDFLRSSFKPPRFQFIVSIEAVALKLPTNSLDDVPAGMVRANQSTVCLTQHII